MLMLSLPQTDTTGDIPRERSMAPRICGRGIISKRLPSPLSDQRTRCVLPEASGGIERFFEEAAMLANHSPKREPVLTFYGAAITTPPVRHLMLSQYTRVSSEFRRLLTGQSTN